MKNKDIVISPLTLVFYDPVSDKIFTMRSTEFPSCEYEDIDGMKDICVDWNHLIKKVNLGHIVFLGFLEQLFDS